MPRGGALDLAAVDVDGRGEDGQPRDRRLRARAHAVQDADRALRRRRGAARAHRRELLPHGCDAAPHDGRARPGREALGHLGDLQMMARGSSAFALLSDISLFVIGGSLKRREKISARLGDILSLLYIASATVKRFHDEGRHKEDRPLLDWAIYDTFFKLQVAM